jgi:LAO/AO transport system kinase
MEIADIFVVNKSDLPGASKKVTEINAMLDIDPRDLAWRPPVVLTNSRKGDGIPELVDIIIEHHKYLTESGELQKKGLQRSRDELQELMKYKLTQELSHKLQGSPEYEKAIELIAKRKIDPYTVAEKLIADFLFSESR